MLGIFLDTETNGLDPYVHRALEIAIKLLDLHTGEEKASFQTVISQDLAVWEKSDLDSLKVNSFTWEKTSKGKPEKITREEIISLFNQHEIKRNKAVFICQNPSFDRAFFSQIIPTETQEMLKWPYHWLDLASMYWATCMNKAKKEKTAFPWEIGFSKDKIAANFSLPMEEKPHRAMNGVNHLIICYEAVVGFPFRHAKNAF
jgi:oligoribonuclease